MSPQWVDCQAPMEILRKVAFPKHDNVLPEMEASNFSNTIQNSLSGKLSQPLSRSESGYGNKNDPQLFRYSIYNCLFWPLPHLNEEQQTE